MRTTRRFARFAAAASASAALAFAGAGSAADASSTTPPTAIAAKSCGSGYTHAVIGGEQKCLRVGEFCAHRYASQYRRYGYSCTHTDARGEYHLT